MDRKEQEKEQETRAELEKEKLLLEREKLQFEKQQAEREQENVQNFKSRELEMREKKLKHSFENLFSLNSAFSEDDAEGFFTFFEKNAEINEWPEEDRMLLVTPKLIGKTLKVYNSLDDYNYVKQRFFYAYAITPVTVISLFQFVKH